MGDTPYLQIFLSFHACVTTWTLYLDKRQLNKNEEKAMPSELNGLVKQDKFEKSQVYQADKKRFSIVSSCVSFFVSSLEVVYLWPVLWAMAGNLVGENEYIRSVTWAVFTSFVSYPVDIPLELYSDFVIEARHGFNKKTPMLFVTDKLKNACITIAFNCILIPIVISVIRWGGEYFYLYMWFVAQILIFVFMTIYPTLIMPLFNKYEPLQDANLRKKIEDLAAELKYPLQKLFQMDGSKRSAHSNAYLFGFWKNKRIVLFDTLLQTQLTVSQEAGQSLGFDFSEESGRGLKVTGFEKVEDASGETALGKWNELHQDRNDELRVGDIIEKVNDLQINDATELEAMAVHLKKLQDEKASCTVKLVLDRKPYTDGEILAILCHEIGHWVHGHVMQMLVITSAHIFFIFRLYAFTMYSGALFKSFGFSSDEKSIMVGLNLFLLMFTPVETVLSAGMTMLTRRNEFQADEFSVKQKRSVELGTGLNKLCLENLGDLNPDWLYAWFNHSHPGLVERLRALQEKAKLLDKKDK